MADSREYLAGKRPTHAAGEAFARAILRELIKAGTECDFAVFTIGSGGPSWVWLRQRSEAERRQHVWAERCAILAADSVSDGTGDSGNAATHGMADGATNHGMAGNPDAV